MKKKTPKVSVIIPVYNAGKYLEKCLNSVVNQTYSNIEIICVNDGSTDSSLEIIKKYAKKYNNIKVIVQENKGVNGARIVGYENATGDYIAWVDADDFIEPTMYEEMIKIAISNDYDIVSCNYNFYPKETTKKAKWFREYKGVIDWKFISKNTIQWNKIVKKKLLDKVNIVELFSRVGEGCYSIVLINAKSIFTLNKCLYNYRVGHSSLSTNYHNVKWYQETANRALNKLEYIREKKYEDKWESFFQYVYLKYVLILMLVGAFNKDKKIYNEAKEILKKNDFFLSKKYSDYLENDFSKLKLLILNKICMNNYYLANILTKIVL